MFALVLKNSMLMLLIIFIIHFMILNYATEITPTLVNTKMTSFTNSIMSIKQHEPLIKTASVSDTIKKIITNSLTNNDSDDSDANNKNDIIDLYNFVFHEEETADIPQLNTYFPNDSFLKSNHVDVPCSQQQNDGSSKQFCLNEVDAFFKENAKTRSISSSQEENSTNLGNHPIIYEYKQSNNGFEGYETYESSFMKI